MNVWCTFSTIFKQRRILQIAGLLTLCVALITTLFLASIAKAAPGVNQTISFQGRLMTPQGQAVADGYYNIQFKVYQDGDGQQAGDTGGSGGTLKWTETYINNGGNNGVYLKNGYFSVDLGSKNAFGSSVDWNQDTLWLSMNVAGSSPTCSTFGGSSCLADGEMLPMKRLTSTPYALNAGMVGGKTVSDLIQNGTTQQTANFNISGTGTANILQGTSSVVTPLLDSAIGGTLSLGTVNAVGINIGTNDSDHTISIGTSTNTDQTVTIGSKYDQSKTTIQGGANGIALNSSNGIDLTGAGSALSLIGNGDVLMNLGSGGHFNVMDSTGHAPLGVYDSGQVLVSANGYLNVNGDSYFNKGINIQGTTTYQTPGGFNMNTAINIQNSTMSAYSSVFAFGLPATSDSTARGMLVADARTVAHQASIGVLSPDENQIFGMSWNGSNSKASISNTASTIALQGNGLDILTATNASGSARVGIGNDASSGYALDVTGSTNVSSAYAINGANILNNTGLNFSAASEASVNAASGQALRLTGDGGVKIGDSTASGDPTLLTLDKASGTPTATGDAVLGSMYYDTTLGKVQCYEADGWGSCSSSPDNFVTLSPEYTNAVTNGAGIGTMSSDICSDALNINDGSSSQPTICGTNETYNFYKWTSSQTSAQTKDIYVTYQLPGNFTGFVSGSTSLVGRTDDSTSNVAYRVYKNTTSGLVACGSSVSVSTGAQTTWQKVAASGSADPANCSFSANDSLVIKISLTAQDSNNAYASTLSFAFSNN